MRRFTSIFLLVVFAALGTGAIGWLHAGQHACADAIAHHPDDASQSPAHPPTGVPEPGESNCLIHALLATPLTIDAPSVAWSAELAPNGIIEATAATCIGSALPLTINCRGPPVVA